MPLSVTSAGIKPKRTTHVAISTVPSVSLSSRRNGWTSSKERLLPVKHFHFVFTIPDALHTMFYINQAHCYKLLFAAAWMAIRKASANPRFSGTQTGGVALLHTWTQTLKLSPTYPYVGSIWGDLRGSYGVERKQEKLLCSHQSSWSDLPGMSMQLTGKRY